MNTNGLLSKRADLQIVIHDEKPAIICCQETRLDDSIQSSEIFPEEYLVLRKDRNSRGGGVCIAITSNYVATPCPELDSDSESIWIKLQIVGQKALYVCSYYRPPSSDVDYMEQLRHPLEAIMSKYHRKGTPHVIVVGDFNYPLINWQISKSLPRCQGQVLVDISGDFYLKQLVKSPTRVDPSTGVSNVLDLAFSTHSNRITDVKVGPKFSDHSFVSFNIRDNPVVANKAQRKIYLYKKGDFTTIRSGLKKFSDWFMNSGALGRSVEDNWTLFKNKMLSLVEQYIPSKLCVGKCKPPWSTREVKRVIRKRDKMAKKSLICGAIHHHDILKKLRAAVRKEVIVAQASYLHDIVGNLKESPSRFYKFINSKRTDSRTIPAMSTKHGMATTDADKAKELSLQFSSVFTREDKENIQLTDHNVPSMPDIVVTEPGVLKLLRNLNPRKAKGPDELAPGVLLETAQEITPIITFLFNQSITASKLPSDWKDANISPVFKKGRKDVAENYRPVSLTSIVCKTLEHIVFSCVSKHLESKKIFTPRQHGFRSGHSCESQLVLSIDDWAKVIDRGSQVDVAILDSSKAFDTVPHERLKSKLWGYGIRARTLSWIDAFLADRRQRVQINSSRSDWAPVTSGVPQGTVMGPLLFLVYINDIVNNIHSQIRLFADDCIVYRQIESLNDCHVLQNDLDSLCKWQDKWEMHFNVDKCHVMHMTRKRNAIILAYFMKEIPLTTVDTCTYLGLEIQNNLRWDKHVVKVGKKANKVLGLLRRNISCCSVETKAAAYMSLVRPLLEYATAAWDPYRKSHVESLEQVQRRAARI